MQTEQQSDQNKPDLPFSLDFDPTSQEVRLIEEEKCQNIVSR